MSIKIMNRVWESSSQTGGSLLVLLALADFADDGGFCYPGVETLAKKSRLTARHVRRIIGELEDSGELIVDRDNGTKQRGKGVNFTNRYRIVVTQQRDDICDNYRGDILSPPPDAHVSPPPDAHVSRTVSVTVSEDTNTGRAGSVVVDERELTMGLPRATRPGKVSREVVDLAIAFQKWEADEEEVVLNDAMVRRHRQSFEDLLGLGATAQNVGTRAEALYASWGRRIPITPKALVEHWGSAGQLTRVSPQPPAAESMNLIQRAAMPEPEEVLFMGKPWKSSEAAA